MEETTIGVNYLQTVLDRQACKKHRAPLGIPCWHIRSLKHGVYLAGACGKRARLAGFVGKISSYSLRKK